VLTVGTALAMPYPGLRPFDAADAPLFFGREAQISAMLRRLEDHRFVAVVGASGCGKSSLVRAGLLPALHEGFLFGTTDWITLIAKPGGRPYQNVARALAAASSQSDKAAEARTLAILRRTDRGLLEALREASVPPESKVMLVVDQFEELFAFRRTGATAGVASRDEAAAFVTMLLRSSEQTDGRLWVVLTMRSDFIGDCEAFLGLPELVSRCQFLVPRLDRGQMEEAITRPGAVDTGAFLPFGFEAGLVNRIINDAGDRPDQLPLMQHALMRTWKIAVNATPGAPRVELTHAHYDEAGGIENALSKDADRALDQIKDNPELVRIARRLFLLLCDVSPDGHITRRHPAVSEVQAATGATVDQIAAVMQPFQQDDRNFLLPPVARGIDPETTLDVSHEALLRRWVLFSADWQERERADVAELRRLTDLAALHQQEQGGLLRGQDLERVLRWKERVTPEWASRYVTSDRWDAAMAFVDESEREHSAAQAAVARARAQALRRARWSAAAMGLLAFSLLAYMIGNRYLYTWDYVEYYKDFVKVYGQPKGIGRLTLDQVHHRPVSFRIVRKGRLGPVQRLESVNSRERPTGRHYVDTYLAASSGDNSETRWTYFYGSDNRVAYEMAYDSHDRAVWTLIYAPKSDPDGARLAQFVGPDGVPRQTEGYGKGFVKIKYSPEGYEEVITYRNAAGQPRSGLDKAFGRRQTFDAEGRVTSIISINPAGQPMIDDAGNAEFRITYDAMGNQTEGVAADAGGAVTMLKDGYASLRAAYDANGNNTEQAFYDERGKPTLSKDGYHRGTQKVDDRGRATEVHYWDVEGKPAIASGGCHGQRMSYDDRDNIVTSVCLGPSNRPAPDKDGVTIRNYQFNADDQMIEESYADADGKAVRSGDGFQKVTLRYDARGNRIEHAYYGSDGRLVVTKDGYARSVSEYDARDHEVARTFFGTDGKATHIAEEGDDTGATVTYARWEKVYDANGNVVSVSHFDASRKLMVLPKGYATFHSTYDESGNFVEAAYYGSDGARVKSKDGYAGWRMKYDELGRQVGSEYVDVRGALVAAEGPVAGWTTSFDAHGNATERRYHGVDRRPVISQSGSAGWRARYDSRGNQTEFEYFDTSDRPAVTTSGYARRRTKFDARNRVVEDEYFGSDDRRALTSERWARLVNRYGELGGEPAEQRYYGIDDRPTLTLGGYHAVRNKFDQYGRKIEFTYYDQNGAPINARRQGQTFAFATLKQKFDPYGRLSEQQMFGADGSPLADDTGVHRWVRRFDERGQEIERLVYGLQNQLLRER
jgi:hypothetical protein